MITLGLTQEPRTAQKTLCTHCIYAHVVRGYKLGQERSLADMPSRARYSSRCANARTSGNSEKIAPERSGNKKGASMARGARTYFAWSISG